jgi:hypothetical protein
VFAVRDPNARVVGVEVANVEIDSLLMVELALTDVTTNCMVPDTLPVTLNPSMTRA